MSAALAWMFVAAGLVAVYRAASAVAGTAPAWLATGALLVGQLLTFELAPLDAAIFAAAAVAVERGLAWQAAGQAWAIALVALPALAPLFTNGLGWPTASRMTDLLFCSQHGVAATSAVVWCGLAGALFDRRLAAAAITMTVGASAAFDETLTWNESTRLFAGGLPAIGVGVAILAGRIGALAQRHPAWATAALLAPLLLFNITLMCVAYASGFPLGYPADFGEIGRKQARLQHEWFGHPLSFPATLVFRASTGLPVAQFDLQGVSHVDAAHPILIDVGSATDVPWLGDGWFGPERGGDVTFRWASTSAAVFLPPLPAGRATIRVWLRPILTPAAPSQTVTLLLGSQSLGSETMTGDWAVIEREVEIGAGGRRAGTLTLTFDHTIRPSSAGPSGDHRDLAGAIDRIEIAIR